MSIDVEALMVAVFNVDQPGDWPKWDDYIAAFGSPGTPPWRRKAEAIAAEYARLVPAEDEGRLTPLQREVETEPSCTRCGQPITRLGDLYRCAQCHAAFDLACIHKHFGWSVNPNPHVVEEANR